MKLQRVKILTDENISPKVVGSLRELGYDVLDIKEQQWHGKNDEAILNIAFQEQRFILTHDADFGTLAINEGKEHYGILYIRLKDLKPSDVTRACETVLQMDIEVFPGTIVVIEETKIRIRHMSADE
jgi:predicted nuclease of predicted toxin-antitoxin system